MPSCYPILHSYVLKSTVFQLELKPVLLQSAEQVYFLVSQVFSVLCNDSLVAVFFSLKLPSGCYSFYFLYSLQNTQNDVLLQTGT